MIFSSKTNSKFGLILKTTDADLEGEKKEGERSGILLANGV